MSTLAKRVIAPKRIRIYSAGGIRNWKLSLIYSPRNALKRVLFRFSLAASIASRESFSLPPDIQQYLERYFASTKLSFIAMTSHYNLRWILAVKSKESDLAILVKYGTKNDPGLIKEEAFHRKFGNIDLCVPLVESFTTNSHRVLVFPYYPTRSSLRANQLELADIANRLEVLQIKHNDLAPWNTVRKNKKLFVIDWEGFEESSERSEIKGQDSQASYKSYLGVSLIASSIGNFLLTAIVARGDFVASELGKFSSLFAAYVLLLGISRAALSEVDIASSLNKNTTSTSGNRTRFFILISTLTSIAIVSLLLSSSVNLGLFLAIILLSGPIVLDYFRFEFLRILDSRSVMLLDVSWTTLFISLLIFSSMNDFYLDPIEYFIVWEVSALLAFMLVLIAKRPRFFFPLVTRQDDRSKSLEKRNKARVLALFDYMAMYGTPLLFSIFLFNVVNGNSAFVFRLSTMLLAVLPLLAQVTLFSSRNLWIGKVLKKHHLDVPEIQREIRSKIVFVAIGGLICLSSLFLPYEVVFTTLKIVGKEEFQLLLFFQFLSYFSIFVTAEIRHWLRYFGDFRLYSWGAAPYLLANVIISVVSLLKRDLILWTTLIALLNVVFILFWTLLYRSASSRLNQQV